KKSAKADSAERGQAKQPHFIEPLSPNTLKCPQTEYEIRVISSFRAKMSVRIDVMDRVDDDS
ncbi:MAG: hypothetical protein K8I60_02190, partial [Anaerolineae bacterium]|nr:hypothetical protein [Anaerolineae bacterium]